MRLTRPSLYTSVPVTNESQDLPGKSHFLQKFLLADYVESFPLYFAYNVEMPNAEHRMTLTLVIGVRKLGESGSIILGSLN